MGVIAGVVFDLDDTLYLERDYVCSGFAQVADLVGANSGLARELVLEYLWAAFEQGVRGNTFSLLLDAYPELARQFTVEALVNQYRAHHPTIRLLAGAELLLYRLQARGLRIGVLSDGNLKSQSSKVDALGLRAVCSPVILTDAWGREYWKPHSRGFNEIAAVWKLAPTELVYVGDNPAKDFRAANELGWSSVRLRMEGQLRHAMEGPTEADRPSFECTTFEALGNWLEMRS